MPELHMRVSDEALASIRTSLATINGHDDGMAKVSLLDIAREAIGLYRWTLEQMAQGQAVGAANADGVLLRQVETRSTQRNRRIFTPESGDADARLG